MKVKPFKTYQAKPADIKPRWYLVNAEGQVLGRLAARIAQVLQGKHRPGYTPHLDTGDHVIVINAGQVRVTGRKAEQKKYYYYTGYMSGLREVPYQELAASKPGQAVRLAVRRMLPKTKLGRRMLGKLKIYVGADHPHAAQSPEVLEIKT